MLTTFERSTPIQVAVRTAWLTVGLCFPSSSEGFAADANIPRYWLKVGQELTYETISEAATPDGQSAVESTWQVWVVKQNSDGSWRLVMRHASTLQPRAAATPAPAKEPPGKAASQKQAGPRPSATKPPASKAPPGKSSNSKPPAKPVPAPAARQPAAGQPAPGQPAAGQPAAGPSPLANFTEQVTFAYCDFSPDGTVAPNPTLGYQFEVRQLLPKLPKTEKELRSGWAELDRSTQVGFRYRVEAEPDEDDDEPQWKIVATRQSPVDDIY
ncbi:MAG: hypothetical protein ACREHD_01275, partial [Pirellulales bacterium]